MPSEYERGFRDGVEKAATIATEYVAKFDLEGGDAGLHLRTLAAGLRTGILARNLFRKGEDGSDG